MFDYLCVGWIQINLDIIFRGICEHGVNFMVPYTLKCFKPSSEHPNSCPSKEVECNYMNLKVGTVILFFSDPNMLFGYY